MVTDRFCGHAAEPFLMAYVFVTIYYILCCGKGTWSAGRLLVCPLFVVSCFPLGIRERVAIVDCGTPWILFTELSYI